MLLFKALSDKQTRQNGVNKNEQAVYLFDVGLRLKAEVCESGLPAESRTRINAVGGHHSIH